MKFSKANQNYFRRGSDEHLPRHFLVFLVVQILTNYQIMMCNCVTVYQEGSYSIQNTLFLIFQKSYKFQQADSKTKRLGFYLFCVYRVMYNNAASVCVLCHHTNITITRQKKQAAKKNLRLRPVASYFFINYKNEAKAVCMMHIAIANTSY